MKSRSVLQSVFASSMVFITGLFVMAPALAADYTWNTDAAGSITDTANWVGENAGAATANTFTSGDSATIGSGTATVPNSVVFAAPLTIGLGAVVLANTGASLTTNSFRPISLSVDGTYRYELSGIHTLSTSSITNTGIIENTSDGTFAFVTNQVAVDNAEGVIRATSGTLRPGNAAITGGALNISSGAELFNNSIATGSFTLQDVIVTNNGVATVTIDSTATGTRVSNHDLTGTTTYSNGGTLNLLRGDTAASGNRTVRMGVASTATLNNSGTINVSLTNTLNGANTNQVYLEGASEFTNEGIVNVTTIAGSTGTAQIRWDAAINNEGTINVTGALSSIQMTGHTFTQASGVLTGTGAIVADAVVGFCKPRAAWNRRGRDHVHETICGSS